LPFGHKAESFGSGCNPQTGGGVNAPPRSEAELK
jgi:hypothetical protein